MAKKDDTHIAEGVVTKVLPNTNFRVMLDESEREIMCHIAGKMRQRYIRIVEGDRVKVAISSYDLTKGRITWRFK